MAVGFVGLRDLFEIADVALDASQVLGYVTKFFKGKGSSPEERKTADRIETLMREGKQTEALDEALGAWETSFGMKDEMRLGCDIASLVDSEIIEDRKGFWLLNVFKQLSPKHKAKFRQAYVSERDRKHRLMLLAFLANLRTQKEVMDSLDGMGIFDPSQLEMAIQGLITPLEIMAKYAELRDRVLQKERRARLRVKKLQQAQSVQSVAPATWRDRHPTIALILGFRIF